MLFSLLGLNLKTKKEKSLKYKALVKNGIFENFFGILRFRNFSTVDQKSILNFLE
ncbi:hypothetical protein R7V77_02080 [Mesomycoplasma ovipneumoniae]|uniref:Transposase n=1 Tax=Mesomycoplasma ovipneumoniae TaxID=29562 RepID=A0AAJ2P922_9BACT|nr:hypothetical protein [Mesomycoplasma ovipneumoniae]MDW2898103.1 hypothetical protein [Mesomycoplasma ovipneumoniae]